MLELLGSGLISLWLKMAGVQINPLNAIDALAWQSSPSLVLAPDPNPAGTTTVQEYLKELVSSKLVAQNLLPSQGIWMQSGPMLMANHQGTTPLPAASLTKIATTLVAFKTWGPDHQFETLVSATGPITNGVLQGNLVIAGGCDPMFVWQDAIALGNTLHQLGIKQVKGDLVITGNFAMNFQRNPLIAGQLLKQALNYSTWNRPTKYEYSIMPKGTPKPQIIITGRVKVQDQTSFQQTLLIRHRSLPLKRLIKEMNIFSNNDMAEMLALSVGGAPVVQSTAADLAGVPSSEIHLINGSGLGPENRISPRAICAMLIALQLEAAAHDLALSDLFLMSGLDHRGTIHSRHIPSETVVKTGTLRDVSSLAGVMPTRDHGLVWFAILNRGSNLIGLRSEQDKLLQHLAQYLPTPSSVPEDLTPHLAIRQILGSDVASRNEVINH